MKKVAPVLIFILGLLVLAQLAQAQSPAPSVTNAVVGAANVTPYDCSGTITAGGTSQNLFPSTVQLSKIRGWMVMNVDTTSEGLCINFTATSAAAATCSSTGYYFMQPATATASGGSYSSQLGFGINNNPKIVAATTSHKYSCTYW